MVRCNFAYNPTIHPTYSDYLSRACTHICNKDLKLQLVSASLNLKKKKRLSSCKQLQLEKVSGLVLTLGSSMKLGLAVEISPSVFREQLTSWDSMSHAASADSLLLSTWGKETLRASVCCHSRKQGRPGFVVVTNMRLTRR